MAASSSSILATQIFTHLSTTKSLFPSPTWLQSFLSTQRLTTPLPALTQSALFRLLASDITTTLSTTTTTPSTCFPTDIHNAEIKERRLAGPIAVQVLDVEDIGKSRWEQVEAIEASERGEGTKGREIIRVVLSDAQNGSEEPLIHSAGPHKLLLQDAKGARVYGIEVKGVRGVGVGMSIGSKMVLTDVLVARGVVLLDQEKASCLGGKIEGLHRAWKEGRKEQLRAKAIAE
ncbi:MAG: hypothetical protein M1827_001630 [Pycnora praestabilis]|nr:MAG: hypothetical protein M1827_001630 [Pycnora praestabilis]